MPLSVPYVVMLAKQREIEELKRLKMRTSLVGALGHLIHALQSERGASSTFLASSGTRLDDTRLQQINESKSVEQVTRAIIEVELVNSAFANAKIISLIGWTLLGLEALPDLRQRIADHQLSGNQASAAYSRVIAGLIALIFELADAAVDPHISRLLVSLFNLLEGKEFAGQERAIGAMAFGSGQIEAGQQQRILFLIENQASSFRAFSEFADPEIAARWQEVAKQALVDRLEELRDMLRRHEKNQRLDSALSVEWFDCCSQRISQIWSIQRELVEAMQQRCDAQIAQAESEMLNFEGLLPALQNHAPARADAIERFFDPELPIEPALHMGAVEHSDLQGARSTIDMLQVQTQHLARMESELAATKRALNERKIIERAKGMLMARYHLTEHEAHKKLTSMAMSTNKRLVELAESVISVTSTV